MMTSSLITALISKLLLLAKIITNNLVTFCFSGLVLQFKIIAKLIMAYPFEKIKTTNQISHTFSVGQQCNSL